jgi:succinoglycan biosynthesis transport protein ExoP
LEVKVDAQPVARGGEELEGSYFVGVPLRRWRVVVGAVVLGLLVGLALPKVIHRHYTAMATVVVDPVPTSVVAGHLVSSSVNGLNEQALATSTQVGDRARSLLHSSLSSSRLLSDLTVTPVAKSDLLSFSFVAPSAKQAAQGANAFARAYLDQRQARAQGSLASDTQALKARLAQVSSQLAQAQAGAKAEAAKAPSPQVASADMAAAQPVISHLADQESLLNTSLATASSARVNPGTISQPASSSQAKSLSPHLELAAGGLGGLLVGIIAAFAWERLDDRIRPRGAYSHQLGLSPLAVVGGRRGRARRKEPIATALRPGGRAATAYGRLAALLTQARGQAPGGVLVVASPTEPQAALTVAANLAASLARRGGEVTLVSTDPTCRPGQRLGLDDHLEAPSPGSNGAGPRGLILMDLGQRGEEGVASWRHQVQALPGPGRHVILAAPALESGEGLVVASWAGQALVVAAAGADRASQVSACLEELALLGVEVKGVVVQGAIPRARASRPPARPFATPRPQPSSPPALPALGAKPAASRP